MSRAMSGNTITFANVSRFYGEVLGVNKVSLTIPPGVTSLVGPNGSGKTTLMNLMTGLIRPSQGEIRVLGLSTEDPEHLCRAVGYCSQFDTYPKGLTGYQFIYSYLRVFGMPHEECDRRTMAALETVGRSEEHTSELQSLRHLVCRLLLEKKKNTETTFGMTHIAGDPWRRCGWSAWG